MDLSMASCNAEKASMKSTEYRKVIKPLLERRRRARINSCLDELKALILETAQNENTDASKLEKADILELTVQHLRSLRQSSRSWPSAVKPVLKSMDVDKFRAGFAECAHEVSSYISGLNVVETDTKSRLLTHLAHCINRIPMSQAPPTCCPSQRMDSLHCHLTTPTPPPSPVSPLRSAATDYIVPVSPISPTPSGECNPYLSHGSDAYLWPEHVNRSFVDTQNMTCDMYDRAKSRQAPYVHPKSAPCVGFEHYGSKPWRPW